jgi:hypothetical protein
MFGYRVITMGAGFKIYTKNIPIVNPIKNGKNSI